MWYAMSLSAPAPTLQCQAENESVDGKCGCLKVRGKGWSGHEGGDGMFRYRLEVEVLVVARSSTWVCSQSYAALEWVRRQWIWDWGADLVRPIS